MDGNLNYNGNSLQTFDTIERVGINTNLIRHTDMPASTGEAVAVADADDSEVPNTNYPNKIITLGGTIHGNSQADLDNRIDTFKSYFVARNKDLDIAYGGSIRRYKAMKANTVGIERQSKALFATFVVELICKPFGINITPTTIISIADRNLIDNPSFETDLTGWTVYSGAALARVTAQQFNGIAAMEMVSTGTGTSVFQGAYTTAPVLAGKAYSASVYVKGTAGKQAALLFSMSDGSTDVNTIITLDGTWQRISSSKTAAANATAFIYVAITDGNLTVQTLYADAVQLEQSATATDYLLNNSYIDSSLTISPTIAGTAPFQLPIITITIKALTGAGDYIQVSNDENGQLMLITGVGFAAGDVLKIDAENRLVTLNDNRIDYNGTFLELEPGAASLTITDGFTTRSLDILIEIYKRYV